MPQMAPIMWLPLFISFILLLFLTSTVLFFEKKLESQNNKLSIKLISNNWLW